MPAVVMPPAFCTQPMPRVLLAGQQGGAAWPRAHQMYKLLGRRAAACPLHALRVHRAHHVHRVRLLGDLHLRFGQRALWCARQVSLEKKYVLQAIFYLSIKKQAAEEAWLARGAPWKFAHTVVLYVCEWFMSGSVATRSEGVSLLFKNAL